MFRFYWLSHKQFQHTVHLNQVLNEYKHSNCIEIDVSLVSFYSIVVAVVVLVIQSYPTLCNPTDCSPPGSSVQGILQARTLEWIAIPFSQVGDGGNIPEPGIKPGSPRLQADSLPSEPPGKPIQTTNCLLNEKWAKLTIEPTHLELTVSIASWPFAKIECRINHK